MRPKKHLGQHFLTAPYYAERIAAAIPAGPAESVLEIGPGQGALSVFIQKRFPGFHVVEIDAEVIPVLQKKLGNGPWKLHREDIMKFDYSNAGFPLHVAGNLPYSIGALIIRKTLMYGNRILSCTFMVQREVARRIVAGPGGKENGFLSIFCQFFGTPVVLFNVPPGAFFPKPAVDSSVFRMILDRNLTDKLPADSWNDFFAFVDRGFGMRRKTLVNALGRKDSKARYMNLCAELGWNPSLRPEELGVGEWLVLFRKDRAIPA
jgi:16S rRNA (adenine1518-N6/adenine1519-N6)-dimethyltransferase